MSPQVWFITGASNGFGLLLTLHILKAGHKVIGTVRNPHKSADAVEQITKAGGSVITLDLEDSRENIFERVQAAEKIYGHIDYLINNGAYSLLGPLEPLSEKEITKQFRTNVYGPLFVIQAALPLMRQRKSGLIVNISSVAGQDALAGAGAYAASKFALEGLSESLSKELAPFGIGVLIIEPGAFRTNFLAAFQTSSENLPDHYGGTPAAEALAYMRNANGKQPGDPHKAVSKIYELISGEGKTGTIKGKVLRYALGNDALARIEKKTTKLLEDLALSKESEAANSSAF